MTTPAERTRALIETNKFLQELTEPDSYAVPTEVRVIAEQLLRHYPLPRDLELLHKVLPLFYTSVVDYWSQLHSQLKPDKTGHNSEESK